jgi:uncharacterized protein YjbI with pentapeptide repeats
VLHLLGDDGESVGQHLTTNIANFFSHDLVLIVELSRRCSTILTYLAGWGGVRDNWIVSDLESVGYGLRWSDSMINGDPLKTEAWQRLLSGESLDKLSLPRVDGRIDLSGLELPEPEVVRQWQTPLANVTQITPGGTFRGVKWRDLDFSGSKLPSLRFYESEIINCRFDRCQLRDLRLCATLVRDCTFRGANLRDTALGAATLEGPFRGRRNTYIGVDFTEADLRGTVYVAAAFEQVIFRNAKLAKIEFGTSTFVDCQFEGELREVLFWRSDLFTRGYAEDAFPPNEMDNVDFSRARLLDVEFRGLSLDQVRLPSDSEHIVIKNFAEVLDKLIVALTQQGDHTARILVAYLGVYRRWSSPRGRGVLNKQALADAVDGDAVERVLGLLHQFDVKVN